MLSVNLAVSNYRDLRYLSCRPAAPAVRRCVEAVENFKGKRNSELESYVAVANILEGNGSLSHNCQSDYMFPPALQARKVLFLKYSQSFSQSKLFALYFSS